MARRVGVDGVDDSPRRAAWREVVSLDGREGEGDGGFEFECDIFLFRERCSLGRQSNVVVIGLAAKMLGDLKIHEFSSKNGCQRVCS